MACSAVRRSLQLRNPERSSAAQQSLGRLRQRASLDRPPALSRHTQGASTGFWQHCHRVDESGVLLPVFGSAGMAGVTPSHQGHPAVVCRTSRDPESHLHRCSAPKTFETIALPAAAGLRLIARSSSPIIKYRPSRALFVTYVSMLAALPLSRPSLAPAPAN